MDRRALTIDGGEKIVSRIGFALIAPEQRPAGTECDARRLSTGRSIRA
jgi:hypothetical protein